jgi:hypothetical protein
MINDTVSYYKNHRTPWRWWHGSGVQSPENGGWYFESKDGITWSDKPILGLHGSSFWNETERVEAPLIWLGEKNEPTHLFVNRATGMHRQNRIENGFVFQILEYKEGMK